MMPPTCPKDGDELRSNLSREELKAELLAQALALGKAVRRLDAQIPVPIKFK